MPIYEIADIIEALNELEAKAGRPPNWNRWRARRFCERAGVRFSQLAPRCKLYITYRAFREALPRLYRFMSGNADGEEFELD